MEDQLSSIQAAKAAISQVSNCSSLLTQSLNLVTKIIAAYCRRLTK